MSIRGCSREHMIYHLERAIRGVHRWLSRSEWAIWLLSLSRSDDTATTPGLVMIQIDGLSHSQFQTALAAGRLPYLQTLMRRDGYRAQVMYSGLPSSTPAVQGELMYGIRCAVPAFSYFDRETHALVRMWDPAVAAKIERRLAEDGMPLLAGGAAYCDIYSGGAEECHFCPSRMGWGYLMGRANPLALVVLTLSNLFSFLRAGALVAVEVALAFSDALTGVIAGQDLIKELRFVLTRVAICVLLRELVTIGAKIDVARGLPIVHVNYLGYDEQAHRRGPGSAFAHWALKGIDDSIARVARAAKRSARREYDVWIYSDHGQEACVPYAALTGRSLEDAVSQSFARTLQQSHGIAAAVGSEQSHRVRGLGGRPARWMLPTYDNGGAETEDQDVTVAAMGPIGHVYLNRSVDPDGLDALARDLVLAAFIPAVLAPRSDGKACAWTTDGTFTLPAEAERILGTDHPFLEEAARDLVDLCHHADAGDLVLCGWRPGNRPVSFPIENGAHGGPGPEETGAFALLPHDAPLRNKTRVARPIDLRQAALSHLGRLKAPPMPRTVTPASQGERLRVMSYNVHSCIGMDGKMAPERIARVIAQCAPDIVALQELDVGRMRTGGVDQAHLIAQHLDMDLHFHAAIRVEEEQYGDAILSRLPMRLVRSAQLPGRGLVQPRGAIWTEISTAEGRLQFLNTHLGLTRHDRRVQIDALIGPDWLGHPDCRAPKILAGDLNAVPGSRTCKRLAEGLCDVQRKLDSHRPKPTFFGRRPTLRIDHVFVDPAIEVIAVAVPDGYLARAASDHLPIVTDLRLLPVQTVDERRGAAMLAP